MLSRNFTSEVVQILVIKPKGEDLIKKVRLYFYLYENFPKKIGNYTILSLKKIQL
jgi:hypothetical protein